MVVVVLLSILIVFAAIIAEVVARWLMRHQNRYFVWAPYYRLDMHLNTAFLPRLKPYVRFWINSSGERGEEIPRGCEHLYRILVAGGSPAECGLLDHDDSWPIVLQRILSEPQNLSRLGACHVHVGNIAKSSTDAQTLDLILEHILPPTARLSMIIIMVGGSNVLNWLKAGAPEDQRYSRPDLNRVFDWQPNGPFKWTPKQTALAEWARRLQQYALRPIDRRYGVGKSLQAARRMRSNALEVRSLTPRPDAMLENFEIALRSVLGRARSAADRVLVVRQPWFEKKHFTPEEEAQFWNGSVGDPFQGPVTIFYSNEVLLKLFRLISERTAKVCMEVGAEQLDLQPVVEPSVTNYYDHLHFTPAGAEIVAREIARYVLEPRAIRYRPATFRECPMALRATEVDEKRRGTGRLARARAPGRAC